MLICNNLKVKIQKCLTHVVLYTIKKSPLPQSASMVYFRSNSPVFLSTEWTWKLPPQQFEMKAQPRFLSTRMWIGPKPSVCKNCKNNNVNLTTNSIRTVVAQQLVEWSLLTRDSLFEILFIVNGIQKKNQEKGREWTNF